MTPDSVIRVNNAAGDRRGLRTFTLICLADVVSLTGSQLTAFGLGVWVYQQTGSATIYGWVALATLGPGILASPFVGALVDRSTRLTMIAGHAGAGLCSLILAGLVFSHALRVWMAFPLIAIASVFNAVQFPGLSSAIPRLVRASLLGRANGLVQFGMCLGQIVSPAAAAAILSAGGIGVILVIDALTFVFALTLLAAVRIPPARLTEGVDQARRRLLEGIADSWRYVSTRPGLLWLLALITAMNFNLGMAQVLLTPFVLGFADVGVLGLVRSVGGIGMLVGGGLLMVWGGPRRLVNGLLSFLLLETTSLFFLGALRPSGTLAAACAFGVLFAIPVVAGCNQTIWQRKVPASMQGRVFAVRVMVGQGVFPFAFLLAGPLADGVFEPLMAGTSPLSQSIGLVLGTGPGRGVRLLFVVLGLLSTVAVALAASSRHLRRVEEELPDHGVSETLDSQTYAQIKGT